jgi:hypothetical protein
VDNRNFWTDGAVKQALYTTFIKLNMCKHLKSNHYQDVFRYIMGGYKV